MMRTTLDIDDFVLAAARARAEAEGVSLGRALSELARTGLERERSAIVDETVGIPVFPEIPGHLITSEMVSAALNDD